MSTREQDLQVLNGVVSVNIGNKHIKSLKAQIADLQSNQQAVNEKIKEIPAEKEIVKKEPSFVVKHAPVIGAIVGAFIVLQFFGFTILALAGIVGLLLSAAAAVAIGFVVGIVVRKNAISQQEKAVQQSKAQTKQEKEDLKNKLDKIKNEISNIQKEMQATQDEVTLLRKNYLATPELNAFFKTHGEEAAELMLLYFERGRADSLEEAMELYKDEAADKARIKRAREEIDRSTTAYVKAYINAMKVLGRSREYSSMENSLDKYNDSLEKENKELREFMDIPEKN